MTPTSDAAPPRQPHRLYVHIAWATLARISVVPSNRRAAIETHMLAVCRQLDVEPVEVRALGDRVHLLVGLPATMSVHHVATAIRSAVAQRLALIGRVVRWSPGFAAVTVSPADLRRARKRLAALEGDPRPKRGPPTKRGHPRTRTGPGHVPRG